MIRCETQYCCMIAMDFAGEDWEKVNFIVMIVFHELIFF